MDRRGFIRAIIGGIAGLFWGFKKKQFTATKVVVGNDSPLSAGGFNLTSWFRPWLEFQRPFGDKGSLWFWSYPGPDVVDMVKLGWRFRVGQDKGNAVIDHAGWSATVPLSPGVLHHVCYVWDEGQRKVWIDGEKIKV